ncbi:unnamed protein product [Closterium sp. NIES-64]|nr:unnamed protein product [Closterium sp. NIES-64]
MRSRAHFHGLAPLVVAIIVSISFAVPAAPLALKQNPRACDYATGSWIPAPVRFPRYSGVNTTSRYQCKYMRALWNCDGTGRPDKIYRSYRWQPEGCNLTYVNPWGFLRLMRNKKLLMVGDSIMGNMYESLLCLITSGPFTHRKVSYRTPSGARFRGFSFPGFRFEIHYYFLPHLMRSAIGYNENGKKGNHGYQIDVDVIDPDLLHVIPAYHGIIFHSMAWWMQNVPGRSKKNSYFRGGKLVEVSDVDAYREAMHNLGQHLKNMDYPGVPYFVSSSPKHYSPPANATKAGACGATSVVKAAVAQLYPTTQETENFYAMQKLSLTGTGSPMRLLRVTRLSAVRPDGHLGLWSDDIVSWEGGAQEEEQEEQGEGEQEEQQG